MIALIYEGTSEDPMHQTVRAIEADSLEHAKTLAPSAIMVQMYVEPTGENPPPIETMMRRAMPVWRF